MSKKINLKDSIKIGFTFTFTLILVTALFSISSTFAQAELNWYCQVSAYGTNVIENEFTASISFRVVSPPSGSEIPNTISARDINNGENFTVNLSPNENVLITYSGLVVDNYSLVQASEPGHYNIVYEGQAAWLQINGTEVPEFSSILIAPLFMTATLLAIFYRRKRTSTVKQ